MSDRDREKRRAKRLQKQKKKRADASRPGRDRGSVVTDPGVGRAWPTGECWVSEAWDEPGAKVTAVFSRTGPGSATVIAVFELDRSGPGLVAARARGGLRAEHVAGECARISDVTGVAMIEGAPGLVAALVDQARVEGTNEDPPGAGEALALLAGVERMEIDAPFGPEPAPDPEPERAGWLSGIRRRLFG